MTCLLSKYPVKYVKKILQKLQKFIIYCRQLLPNAWQCRKPATGSSLRTHGDKKTAIIILFIMMAVTYSILSYTFHLFRRINYYFILFIPVAISRINNRCRDDVYLYQLRTVATVVMPVFFVMYFFLLKDDSLNVMNYRFFF